MATRNIVPRANEEGNLGTSLKNWLKGWFKDLYISGDLTDGTNSISISELVNVVDNFGKEYQYVESLGESSTTSTSMQQKLRLTTSSLPAGTYRIGWSYEYGQSGISDSFGARVQIDDVTTIMQALIEIKDTTDEIPSSGFAVVSLSSGVHFIDLDFNAETGTSYIRNARLEIWRIS